MRRKKRIRLHIFKDLTMCKRMRRIHYPVAVILFILVV